MSDDDELRDALGREIADALDARAPIGATVTDATIIQRRASTMQQRRRVLTGLVVVALVLGGGGVVAATRGHASGVRVATSPTTPRTTIPRVPATQGHKVVSFDGVHVEVPRTWPVVDGMHTGFCAGPFPKKPTAFVGPNDNGAPSCPYIAPRPPLPDGVWLLAEPRPTEAGVQARTLPSGVRILAEPASDRTQSFWYRGVGVIVGRGPDRRVAASIVESIGYTSGLPDTPRAGVCARGDSSVMPRPERLTKALVLDHATEFLEPTRPADQPSVSAARIWQSHEYRENYEQYRLILTRYTSLYPQDPGPNGYRPTIVDRLAWIVYATPRSPQIEGCGGWNVDSYDARTGQELIQSGYGPGP